MKKARNNDSNFDSTEHKLALDKLLKILDGCWFVGIDRKTGKTFAFGQAKKPSVADAISILGPKFSKWIDAKN